MKNNPSTGEPITIATCRRRMALGGSLVMVCILNAFLGYQHDGNIWRTLGQLCGSSTFLLCMYIHAANWRRIASGEIVFEPLSAKTRRRLYLGVIGTWCVGDVILLGAALWIHNIAALAGALVCLVGLITAMFIVARTGDNRTQPTR